MKDDYITDIFLPFVVVTVAIFSIIFTYIPGLMFMSCIGAIFAFARGLTQIFAYQHKKQKRLKISK